MRVHNQLSDPFTVERGVKQGSVFSPTLILTVMDQLLKQLKEKKLGLSWLLDATTIKMLECEIGCRIFHLPKNHSSKVVRLGLQWPSVATHILIHKLTFLAKLLANTDDIISSRIFTSLAIVDVYNVGIVQQC